MQLQRSVILFIIIKIMGLSHCFVDRAVHE